MALTLNGNSTVKVIDNSKDFNDVSKNNVFYNDICSMSAREIMIGTSDDVFNLHSNVTLNQVVNVAERIIGAVDVKDYNAGIVWGKANNLITGNTPANRGQVLQALYIAAVLPVIENPSILTMFKDSDDIPAEMVAASTWAAQNGILKGTIDGKANLRVNVTRGQACALASRTIIAID